MIGRFFRSRGMRKFRRDRLAVAASCVIGVYLAIAVAIFFFGLVTEEETFARVGPNNDVGFLEQPTLEQRVHHLEFYLEKPYEAAESREPEKALARIDYAGATVIEATPDELIERIDPLWETFDELIELLEEEVLADDPEALARLAELEAEAASLYVRPEGYAAWGHRLARFLGTDRQGRSIFLRALYSIKVAAQIGLVAAFVSVLIGTILGGAAAFFGGWVDHMIVWLYSTFAAIPYIVLLMVLAAIFLNTELDGTLVPVYTAFCLTFWIGPCRLIRGEVMKLRELEYVEAATAVGFGRMRILLNHIIPNTAHLMFINFSLLFIGAIKAEVILSFLGLGVKNEPSWGVMINQSKTEVLNGFFWQIGTATAFMFVLVLAFNILSDALQDAFDPKHV
jgi:peptide/nickel transport system permease protein